MKKIIFIIGILTAQLSFAQLYTSGGVVNQSATPNSPNVGVGISNPQSKLTVYEGGGVGSNHFELRTNHLRNPERYFMKNIIFGTGTEDITFSLRHDGQMYVNGKVGIGSVNPQAKFEVAQELTNDKNFVTAQFLASGATGGSNIVSIGFHNKANLEINSAYASSGLRYGNFADFNIENDSDSPIYGSINFITNKKIQMAIRPNGNALLNGKLEAKELKVTLTPTADFVFDENYDLPKLEDVAKHIKEKKHLPEIASAKVMETEGVNVGEFQIKLLQKIEELTLYVIKQDQQIKKLETENVDLKNAVSEIKQLKEQFLTMKSNTTR